MSLAGCFELSLILLTINNNCESNTICVLRQNFTNDSPCRMMWLEPDITIMYNILSPCPEGQMIPIFMEKMTNLVDGSLIQKWLMVAVRLANCSAIPGRCWKIVSFVNTIVRIYPGLDFMNNISQIAVAWNG